MKQFKSKMSIGIFFMIVFFGFAGYVYTTNTDYNDKWFIIPFVGSLGLGASFAVWIWQLLEHNSKTKKISKKLKGKNDKVK